jgi:hypothetical protein
MPAGKPCSVRVASQKMWNLEEKVRTLDYSVETVVQSLYLVRRSAKFI